MEQFYVSGWDDDDRNVEEDGDEIHLAAENGNVETVENLLKDDSNLVHARDKDGYTPLHRACYGDHLKTVEVLLRAGADLEAGTLDGWRPLHSACRWNNARIVALLLAHGACVNAPSEGAQTPLHLAASHSHSLETLQLLLMHPSIRPELKNSVDETAEDIAVRGGPLGYMFEMTEDCVNKI